MKTPRRGTCPGIDDPMPTGDGLLARLIPSAPIPMDTWLALCAASERHGNGVMEVTQRGSLQIRGLSPESAPAFAAAVAALGLAGDTRPPLLTPPLLGLEAGDRLDVRDFVGALRKELCARIAATSIDPKVSVLIDTDGALHLDGVTADVRLRMQRGSRMHLALAGDAASSANLGWVEPRRALDAVVNVVATIAKGGPGARARNFVNNVALCALRESMSDLLLGDPPPLPRPPAEPIGVHHLQDGRIALGFALAFGYASASRLTRLGATAARLGAVSIRPAPGRSLLAIGLSTVAAEELASRARADGFIVQLADARRHVVSCAGAPACRTAALETRRLAPAIARAAESWLDGSVTIHVSGCSKGCAHPGAAALTLIGPDRLVVRGRASDGPHGAISPATFIAGLQRLQLELGLSGSRERSADVLARTGTKRLVELLGGEAAHE